MRGCCPDHVPKPEGAKVYKAYGAAKGIEVGWALPLQKKKRGRREDGDGADGRSNGIRIQELGLIEQRHGSASPGSVRGEEDVVFG
jgi:hypothetical protein